MDNKKNIFFNTELESGNQSIIMRDHTDIENTSTRLNFEYLIYNPCHCLKLKNSKLNLIFNTPATQTNKFQLK